MSQPVAAAEANRNLEEDAVTRSVESDAHRLRNGIIWTVGLLVLLLAIGLAVPDLRGVLERAASAAPGWLMLGIGLELLSCLGYVAVVRLVLYRGPAREVRALAWAEMAFGAVVQIGGAGGLAVGAWAMRAWGISWSRIANRSAVIFLLTSAVNVLVLGVAGIGIIIGVGAGATSIVYGLVPAAVSLVVLGLFALLPSAAARLDAARRGPIALALRRTGAWVRDTEEVARRPDWRLLGALGYLLFDIAVLWACLRAVGIAPPVFALIAAYQIGYLVNVVPIPGGVGVLEGGLLAALLLYGFPAAPSAAAVVLYHAIALWIPALGGTIGFVALRGSVSERRQADQEKATTPAPSRPAAVTGVRDDLAA